MTVWGLPRAEGPEQIGLSSARLERLGAVIREDVERKLIPGAVLVIARFGRVGFAEAFGWRDREAGAPMSMHSIFRIASMTKPITSVAAMMLSEEGRLEIAAPVAQYLPEFAELTVGTERRKVGRTMTVQDLMRHTSGLCYPQFGDSPVQVLRRRANLLDPNQTNAELVEKLSGLPLMFEPGTTWEYSLSTDVLGRIVEIISGKSLADFFVERITEPLGMVDTSFAASGALADRVAEPQVDPATGQRPPMRNAVEPGRWQSGGGGLVSTAADYLRFCQMLLNGGELDGVRLLSPKTVAYMTADHLPPDIAFGPICALLQGFAPTPRNGQGFGLGFEVRTAMGRAPIPGSVGTYSWAGSSGASFWIDPQEQLIAVLMLAAPDQLFHYSYLSTQLVYATLTRPRGRGYR
jgi:CubicO group peptidase (beta-lactamase class C family)